MAVGIYKITSPKGRVYIGQTTCTATRYNTYSIHRCKRQPRLYASLVKYGFSEHIFEVVEECTTEELNVRERHWQDFYDVLGDMGLNCKLTRTEDKPGKHSQETKDRIGRANKGKVGNMKGIVRTESHQSKLDQSRRRPILQYTVEGEFLREWPGMVDAQKAYNTRNIGAGLSGRQKTVAGFIWKRKGDSNDT